MKSVSIFQIRDMERCPYVFRDYMDASKRGFNLGRDYRMIYHNDSNFDDTMGNLWICDDLFTEFNTSSMEHRIEVGYAGRSLSVSDVISIDGKLYYCDSFGWSSVNGESHVS